MTRQEFRWIVRLWRPFAIVLVTIVAVTLISTVARVALPQVQKRIFDGLETSLSEQALFSAVVLYLLIGLADWGLTTALVFMRGAMNSRFEWAARDQAYGHLVRHAPGFFQRYRTGDLVTRLTDDVSEKLSWFICSGIFRAIAALAVIVFAIVMMVRLDPLLTLFTVGPLPVLIFLFIRTGTRLDDRFEAVQTRISDLNAALEACFSGIRVVKAYGRERAEERAFAGFAAECRRAEIEAAKSQTLVDSMFGHVWQLGVVAVLLAGGIGVMNGRLTIGTFVAFDAYVLMLIFPMFDIGTLFVRGRQSSVSIGRLLELELTRPEIVEEAGARELGSLVRGDLAFEAVAYAYGGAGTEESPVFRSSEDGPGGTELLDAPGRPARDHGERVGTVGPGPSIARAGNGRAGGDGPAPGLDGSARPHGGRYALHGIRCDVHPGEIVAVVGPVGAGKSTLLRLVPRLTDPTTGRVLIDGSDMKGLSLRPLRRAIGYVPQEALLFSGTIRENIQFGRAWVKEKDIAQAVEIARLARDLAGFTDGLETLVGVRGLTLSGGQKQRVALARALAGRPRILVLDDVTAALDAETEAALWEELHRVLPDLTTIVVTHRTSTLERADRILVLQRGELIESGTHADLAERGPVYRSLYQRHRLEERVGAGPGMDRAPDAGREPSPGPSLSE